MQQSRTDWTYQYPDFRYGNPVSLFQSLLFHSIGNIGPYNHIVRCRIISIYRWDSMQKNGNKTIYGQLGPRAACALFIAHNARQRWKYMFNTKSTIKCTCCVGQLGQNNQDLEGYFPSLRMTCNEILLIYNNHRHRLYYAPKQTLRYI